MRQIENEELEKRVTVYKHLKPIFVVTETDLFNLNPAKEFSFSPQVKWLMPKKMESEIKTLDKWMGNK